MNAKYVDGGMAGNMKYLGMLFILISAVAFSYERGRRAEKHLELLEEIYRFIDRLEVDIGCYLRPISDIIADFSSDLFSELGFFAEMQERGIYSAYLKMTSVVPLAEKENKLLARFFSMLGNGYADEQVKLIRATASELSEIIKRERGGLPKEKKLSVTLSCAAALALIILLI